MGYTLVTGATSDIGKQICKTLSDVGYKLLMTDVLQDALIEFNKELGNNHLILSLDLSDVEKSKDGLQLFLKNADIKISHVVFAAGVFAVKPLRMIDYAFIKKNFDIALFSVFEITRLLVSKKINSDALQNIVFVSSVSAIMGTKGYSVYSAVKAGMLGLMKSMAVELAPKIKVNAVMPGGVRTRTTQFMYDANGGHLDPRYVLGEGFPIDIANTIEFLLSEKARWITGQAIAVDGGLTCC